MMTAGFGELKDNGYIDFNIITFPSPWGLKPQSQVSGNIRYRNNQFLRTVQITDVDTAPWRGK
jgi:hypothetical protein